VAGAVVRGCAVEIREIRDVGPPVRGASVNACCVQPPVAGAEVAGREIGIEAGMLSRALPTMANNARERALDHRMLLRLNALGFSTHGGVE
jgi:hypothetical protein